MVVLNVELEAGFIQELTLAHMTGDFHMFEKGTFVWIEIFPLSKGLLAQITFTRTKKF